MNQEQEQDRTEPASPFKLDEARKRGQVAKSLDVNSALMMLGMLLVMMLWADDAWHRLAILWVDLLQLAASDPHLSLAELSMLGPIASALAIMLAPIAVAGIVISIVSNLIQTGPILSAFPIKPRFERINPIAGFKRVFNKRMLFEAFKSVLKLLLLGGIAAYFFVSIWQSLPLLQSTTPAWQSAWLGEHTQALLFRLTLALVIVALLDWLWSRFQFAEQMKMSRREQREEVKRREGDPLIRAKLRELQRENLKQARSMGRVKDADVIITNPEHVAVALRYVRGEMSAPQVLAKGADHWAAAIRKLAAEHQVPIVERRPLARALFAQAQLDSAIPAETFLEVARLYAELAGQREARRAPSTVIASSAPTMSRPVGN